MKQKQSNIFFDKWVLYFFLLVFVDVFLKIHMGAHGKIIGTAIEIFFLVLLNINKKIKKNQANKTSVIFLLFCGFLFFTIMFCFHIIAGENVNNEIIYVYTNYIFFLYFALYSKIDNLENIGTIMKILTIIGSVSVLFIKTTGMTEAEWREDALIDKGYLTIFFAIAQCLCITDILFKKNIMMNFLLLIFFLYVNMFFVQSKTAFVSMGGYFIISFFLLKGKYRKYLLFGLCCFVVLAIAKPDVFLSDSMASAVNIFFNNEFFSLDADTQQTYTGTFAMREKITDYCLLLFLKSPFWGIGIGGYAESGGLYGVIECESSYFDMLVDGGVLYFIPVFANILIPFICLFLRIKNKLQFTYKNFWSISVLTCILICFYWNDFLFPFVFALIGICSYIAFNKNVSYDNTSPLD